MKSTYIIALVIAAVLIVWLASGQLGGDASALADEAPAEQAAAPERIRVRTALSEAQAHARQIVIRGRTQAKRIVQVRAETSGRVEELPVEKGAVVAQEQLLCRLSEEDRDIKVTKARAAVRHAELEHAGAQKLAREGYQSEINIARTEVDLINARADLKSRTLDLDYRNIRSPFAGIVQDRPAEIGDFIERGGVCAEILDPDPMLLVAHVSEQEIATIEIGGIAHADVSTGGRVEGRISFISHAADPTTRTYRVEVEVENADYALRDGLSADVFLSWGEVLAHRVSPALLSLSDEGTVGIKILDRDNTVQFVEVNVVSDTENGVWLDGLPDTIRLITLGQELVFDGQTVEPVIADTASSGP